MENKQENIDILIAKRLSGGLTDAEMPSFDSQLKNDPQFAETFDAFQRLWDDTATLERACAIAARRNDAWQHVEKQTTQKRFSIGRTAKTLLRVAAVVIPVAVGIALWQIAGNDAANSFTYTAQADRDNVRLPDNSTVVLNKNSQVVFCENDGERLATISGIGYFEVVPDREKPFVVEAADATITVVGTAFTVENVAGRDRVRVDVSHGKVQFEAGGTKTLLAANDNATWHNGQIETGHSDENTAEWIDQRLRLNDATLQTTVNKLMTYYTEIKGIKGNITDNSTTVTTEFSRQPIGEVLDELNIHFDEKIVLDDNGYLIISD